MDMLRKSVTVIFAIFAFFTASIASAEPSKHHIVEIADGVYSFTTNGEYISMFAITDDGVIVFETVNTPHANAMVDAIGTITDKPVK